MRGVSPSYEPSESASSSARLMPTACDANLLDQETGATSTKSSSKSTEASTTSGAQYGAGSKFEILKVVAKFERGESLRTVEAILLRRRVIRLKGSRIPKFESQSDGQVLQNSCVPIVCQLFHTRPYSPERALRDLAKILRTRHNSEQRQPTATNLCET
jgi:hypothetical protein